MSSFCSWAALLGALLVCGVQGFALHTPALGLRGSSASFLPPMVSKGRSCGVNVSALFFLALPPLVMHSTASWKILVAIIQVDCLQRHQTRERNSPLAAKIGVEVSVLLIRPLHGMRTGILVSAKSTWGSVPNRIHQSNLRPLL